MKNPSNWNRRNFIKATSILAGGLTLGSSHALDFSSPTLSNPLPRWKGFNLLDFFSADPAKARPATQEEYFKWMADWGFNFVRIPMAYPSYLKFDRSKPIEPKRIRKFDKKAVAKALSN